MWNVRPGDKVTLARHVNWTVSVPNLPVYGEVYTVRDAYVGHLNGVEQVGIRLVELVNPQSSMTSVDGRPKIDEIGFVLKVFRPVISHKGMETLRSLLTNPKLLRETNPLDVRKVKVG